MQIFSRDRQKPETQEFFGSFLSFVGVLPLVMFGN